MSHIWYLYSWNIYNRSKVEIPKFSNLISIFRSMIFLPICLFVLPKIFGLNGIWASVLTSESITFVVMFIIANVKKYTDIVLNKEELLEEKVSAL